MPTNEDRAGDIRDYYSALFAIWGPQHWWPGRSRFEVIVGSYLTQNTSWNNVEKAIRCLRRAGVLSIDGIRRTPRARLEKLIRSAGYFRQKAQRLKAFVSFLDERHQGTLTRMFAQPTARLREELLALNGVGPETADSILLYAGNHPVFVVDAYTRRILERHGLVSSGATYEDIRELFERALASLAEGLPAASTDPRCLQSPIRPPQKALTTGSTGNTGAPYSRANNFREGARHRPSRMSMARRTALVQVFNEMHGLIVGVGKNYCKKSQMRCEECPLQKFLPGKC